jgi:DNA polymerase/3'-5' exonuclease PolX
MPTPTFKEALSKLAAKVLVTGDFSSAEWLASVPEAEIFQALKLDFISPERRER